MYACMYVYSIYVYNIVYNYLYIYNVRLKNTMRLPLQTTEIVVRTAIRSAGRDSLRYFVDSPFLFFHLPVFLFLFLFVFHFNRPITFPPINIFI